MIPQLPQKKKFKQFSFSIATLLILGLFEFSLLPANAQGYFPLFPSGLLGGVTYPSFSQIPSYPFFTPFNTPLVSPRLAPGLPTASTLGSLTPWPGPIASISGVTTIFIPPSVTVLDKIVIKPPDLEAIKLEDVTGPFPLTVYIYPSGYIPSAPEPVPIPVPTITVAPGASISSTALPPAASVLPATVSGAFAPFLAPNRYIPGIFFPVL